MEHELNRPRTIALWVASIWLVLSSLADLVLLNVAVVTGRLAGPGGTSLLTGGAWIAAVLSAVLLLVAGLRLMRLDRALVVVLAWGATLAAVFVALRLASTGGGPGSTAVGMIPRLALALGALLLVVALRKRDTATALDA